MFKTVCRSANGLLTSVSDKAACRCRRFLSSARVRVSHDLSLLDQEVTVSGEGLQPRTTVKLVTRLENPGERFRFQSTCFFRTDDRGSFSTSASAPLAGSSYAGVHGSGPLWSVQAAAGHRARLWPGDITQPLTYSLTLSDGSSDSVLAATSTVKTFVGPGVRRRVVREGAVRGVLFLPPQPGPGVITIYGTVNNGQVPEDRAALLASHGFVSLALAFFGVEDLQPLYTEAGEDLEYFEAAADLVLALPEVRPNKLGLFGSSLGGNLSLLMATQFGAKISACAATSAPCVSAPGPARYRGVTVTEATSFCPDNILSFRGGLAALVRSPGRRVPLEQAACPLLLLVGGEDEEIAKFARYNVARARELGKQDIILQVGMFTVQFLLKFFNHILFNVSKLQRRIHFTMLITLRSTRGRGTCWTRPTARTAACCATPTYPHTRRWTTGATPSNTALHSSGPGTASWHSTDNTCIK